MQILQKSNLDGLGPMTQLRDANARKEVAQHANELWQANVPSVQQKKQKQQKRKTPQAGVIISETTPKNAMVFFGANPFEITSQQHLASSLIPSNMDVSKNSTPKWMVHNGKPYEQMDDLGVPLFLDTPMWMSWNMTPGFSSNTWVTSDTLGSPGDLQRILRFGETLPGA